MPSKRIAIFLDGTWNNRDDSTNVRQAALLTLAEGEDGVRQVSYYDEGVGTGLLDGITGGAFGLGLEVKVRAAYNWLVEQYNEPDQGAGEGALQHSDEIYIFGFSRGAYTARSLVGLIAACGLLRRGAPLTTNELWQRYGTIGREKEGRDGWWERLVGEPSSRVKGIINLKTDNGQRRVTPEDALLTEELLIRWSRRVKITYLGIFDTVGAMGLDALAIPMLRGKISLQHNMRPTLLIQSCRHALAIDENRSSFSHTTLREFLPNGWDEGAQERQAAKRSDILQRWFTGAHSNIGGGYASNPLASRPLAWVLQGANARGLGLRSFHPGQDAQVEQMRDSYDEFMSPLWAHVVRAKRNYRRIAEPLIVRGSHVTKAGRGYSLRGLNESVDPSVATLAAGDGSYAPPQLVEFARRLRAEAAGGHDQVLTESKLSVTQIDQIAKLQPRHRRHTNHAGHDAIALLWCSLAGLGVGVLATLFFSVSMLPIWLAGLMAAGFGLVDVAESRTGFSIALDPEPVPRRAIRDVLQWFRMGATASAAVGVVWVVQHFIELARGDGLADALLDIGTALTGWHWLALGASAGLLISDMIDRAVALRRLCLGVLVAVLAMCTCGLGIAAVTTWIGVLNGTGAPILAQAGSGAEAGRGEAAGVLLFVQFLLLLALASLRWVGRPLGLNRFGSILKLQRAVSPSALHAVLDAWELPLRRSWESEVSRIESAQTRLREILRESLWRDLVGFIPVYSAAIGACLWMHTQHAPSAPFNIGWLAGIPTGWFGAPIFGLPAWLLLIALVAAADTVENISHLDAVGRYPAPAKTWLTAMGAIGTGIKTVGLLIAGTYAVFAFASVSWEVLLQGPTDSRSAIASLATLAFVAIVGVQLAIGVRGILSRFDEVE